METPPPASPPPSGEILIRDRPPVPVVIARGPAFPNFDIVDEGVRMPTAELQAPQPPVVIAPPVVVPVRPRPPIYYPPKQDRN